MAVHLDGTDLPCQEFPAPSLVPGSCEGPATLTIPAMLEEVGPTLLRSIPEEVGVAGMTAAAEGFFSYRLNGEPVEFGSTHELTPGVHVVTLHGGVGGVELPPALVGVRGAGGRVRRAG